MPDPRVFVGMPDPRDRRRNALLQLAIDIHSPKDNGNDHRLRFGRLTALSNVEGASLWHARWAKKGEN